MISLLPISSIMRFIALPIKANLYMPNIKITNLKTHYIFYFPGQLKPKLINFHAIVLMQCTNQNLLATQI
ncbi:hypothetical protein BHY_0919 (plasmid) [Borrelia nietonii YOR]|uniref:Uncharacterized protein n=2 Tax=Borrelia TaxID=138 RepID=W5T4W2_BORHE|nr:hypothetical protein BHY_0919 [Borrelia nietonii YOR]AHH14375.1 hypothetical protein BHW_0900002 [Borrelia hermsii MTW]